MSRSYRFFIDSKQLGGQQLTLTRDQNPELLHQFTKVLRIKPNDVIVLLSSDRSDASASLRYEYLYTVEFVDKKSISFRLKDRRENNNELSFALELVLCLPNSADKLRFVMEKAVELGVIGIVLVHGDHSRLQQKLRPERLHSIVKEAAEQSERGVIPLINFAGNLQHFLKNLTPEEISNAFVAMERSEVESVKDVVKNKKSNLVRVVIGPEGGFSQQEKDTIISAGFPCFSLGKRILRYETAAIVALGYLSL